MNKQELTRFERLTFADFRRMARDESLSQYEKIGFPDSYRAGAEGAILEDIVAKLPALQREGQRILDIGPGCSGLPRMLLDLYARRGHDAVYIDSAEMLAQLPDAAHLTKIPGAFPDSVSLPDESAGTFDAILAYSVIHYVFAAGGLWRFVDRALELLAHEGAMLIGDIPNVTKRRRFFSSPAGVAFHKRYMQTDEPPDLGVREADSTKIDDEVVLALLTRVREAGFDAYVMPLRADLPLANRREDIVVVRP